MCPFYPFFALSEGMLARGFTLAEVVAIKAGLAALSPLVPALLGARGEESLKQESASRIKQVGIATQMYVSDWDEIFPTFQGDSGRYALEGITLNSPIDLAMMPYCKDGKIFHSPKDTVRRLPFHSVEIARKDRGSKQIPRSLLYASSIHTFGARGLDRNTGLTFPYHGWPGYGARSLSEVDAPADTAVWIEAWPSDQRDAYVSGFPTLLFEGCDTRKLAGRDRYLTRATDVPPGCTRAFRRPATWGHDGKVHVGMVDSSVQLLSWSNARMDDFEKFRIKKSKQR